MFTRFVAFPCISRKLSMVEMSAGTPHPLPLGQYRVKPSCTREADAGVKKISGCRHWRKKIKNKKENVGRAKIFPESSKHLHDYMFIIPDQRLYFWKQIKIKTHVRTSFLRVRNGNPSEDEFGGKFVMNACVASFFLFLIFREAIQWFDEDGNLDFAADFQERKQTFCDFVWNHDTSAISLKLGTVIWFAIG